MIRFPCPCKQHQFEVADDDAGRQLQCPRCGRLNDVPSLSDLAAISDDGTYKLGATIDRHEAEEERLAQLKRAFERTRVDEYGREIDLRPTMEDVLASNVPPPGPNSSGSAHSTAPKYDPITGELIREMELRTDPRLTEPKIPVAARTINYAGHETGQPASIPGIFMQLFSLPNVIVMMFIFIIHVCIQLMAVSALVGMLLVVPIAFFIVGTVVAHYANTVDETGPEQRDELPRPMRGLSWHDDLWGSFVNFMAAVMVSYGPGVMALWTPMPQVAQLVILGAGTVFGTIVFPAALLTSTTSGTWLNLRPDRLFGVIRTIGPVVYLFAILLWIAAGVTYVGGFITTNLTIVSFLGWNPAGAMVVLTHWAVSYPLLLVGIYLMHAFCWLMGVQYRKHHDVFPWVLQRYVKGPKDAPKGGRHGFAVLAPKSRPYAAQAPAPVAAKPVPVVAPRPVQPLPALPAELDEEEIERARLEQRRARMAAQNREMNITRPPQTVLPIDDELERELGPPRSNDQGRGFPLD